jgi:hypothetical protein
VVTIARTLLAVSLVGLAACASAPTSAPGARVAVFAVEAVKPVKLRPPRLRALAEGAAALIEAVRGWRTVEREAIERAIASSGKRPRRARPCHDAPCQVKVGRALSATHALALRVEGNLLGQCDLYVALYDLKRSGRDRRAHVRAGCGDQALQLSTARALCQALREDAASDGVELDGTDCLAAAELTWLEGELEAIRRSRVSGPDGLVALERRLAEAALELRRSYDRVVAVARGRWAVSAICRQGAIYEAFADALAASAEEGEPPEAIRRQGADALASYRAGMRKAVEGKLEPHREQARRLYASCLEQAARLKVGSRFVEEARRRELALRRR